MQLGPCKVTICQLVSVLMGPQKDGSTERDSALHCVCLNMMGRRVCTLRCMLS